MDDPLQPSAAASAAIFHADAGVEDDADSVARHGGKEPFRETKAVRAIPGMEGGAGEFSYTRNSSMQSKAVDILKPILKQKIGELNFDGWEAGSTVRMADFGCSVGANALQYAEICFQSVQDCCQVRSSKPPAVQYFFCDLPSNDFNTLFRQLEEWRNSRPPGAEWKNFFAAAVPGSFHNRLFPSRSLHVAISVLALHWMSQVLHPIRNSIHESVNVVLLKVWLRFFVVFA
jgi:gibberellin A4 carboxyl methyltransferase